MLYRILFSILPLFSIGLVAQAQSNANYDTFTVQVDGIGCSFCAYGLEKKFKELKGLKKTTIDLETGTFTFLFPTQEALTVAQVKQQVAAAGYTAVTVEVERSPKAPTQVTQTVIKPQKAILAVAGTCGMCKTRIEKAATAVEGVQSAYWDRKRQQLQLVYLPSQVDLTKVAQQVAQRGHDTELTKASKKDYDNLQACCLYERMP